jgi:hypothetical protein
VHYAERCTRMEVIDDVTFAGLAAHFEPPQIAEICLTVGMSNAINRFRIPSRSEADPQTHEALAPTCRSLAQCAGGLRNGLRRRRRDVL